MNNGHFAGRIKKFVDEAVEKAKGTEGQLYKIMNAHGFYDVADENNGLTNWQRASVPSYNQHRISEMCDAIAEMIGDMLSNEEYGILYPNLDDVVGKLDLNATKTAAEMNVVRGALAPLTFGQSETAMQSMGQLTAVLMGGFAFDPDILPPIALNIPGLPLTFANAYPKGSFPADWTFLYDHETVKSKKFYEADDGGIAIGANIKLNLGQSRQQILKLVFSVPDVDENGMTKGDAIGGLSPDEFNKMFDISDKTYSEAASAEASKDTIENFELDDDQMQLAFFRYIQLTLWGAIKNPDNWAYLHWGCLTHNACPSAVKTAICSFIHTNGFAVDPKICPEAGLISYCVNMGMSYLTGRTKPVYMFVLPDMTYLDDKNQKVKATAALGWSSNNNGVPVDKKLANLHFTLAADILSHLTYDTNPNRVELRKRRVDEANLIYKYVGLPTMNFKDTLIPSELAANAMEKRGLLYLVKGTIKVYENKNSTLPLSDGNFKIVNQAEKGANELSDITIRTIKYILAKAGLPGIVVTSVYRSPEAQTRAMFNNRQNHDGGIAVNYAAKGRAVDQCYTDVSKQYYHGHKITDPAHQKQAKDAMQAKCQEFLDKGTPVSNHGYDQTKLQAVDMGPKSSKAYFKFTDEQMRKMNTACWDAYQEGYLKIYLGPQEYGGPKVKDPAFHIEVWQDSKHKHPEGFGSQPAPPSVDCKVLDENLKNKNTWDLVYVHDQTLA